MTMLQLRKRKTAGVIWNHFSDVGNISVFYGGFKRKCLNRDLHLKKNQTYLLPLKCLMRANMKDWGHKERSKCYRKETFSLLVALIIIHSRVSAVGSLFFFGVFCLVLFKFLR